MVLVLAIAAGVLVERTVFGLLRARRLRLAHRYSPLVRRALAGDDAALGLLVAGPARHRLAVARLLIEPLIDDRDPARIARTRAMVGTLSIIAIAVRYLRSWLWWRRAVALRALGVLQLRNHTAAVVAALDDPHPDVRAAALDGLDVLARRHLASSGRRATARRVAAPRPPAGRARGVRAGVRGLPARLVAGRRRAPAQLRAGARGLRHRPIAAGARAMDARRASRGPRRCLRGARARGRGRRGGQPGHRGAHERRRSRPRDGRVRAEWLDGLRRRRRYTWGSTSTTTGPWRCVRRGRSARWAAPARSSCRRARRAPISPAASRARCCRRWAHDAERNHQLHGGRLQRGGHRCTWCCGVRRRLR